MLSVKQGTIKYIFKIFWYEITWDWNAVSRAIGDVFMILGFLQYQMLG